MLPDKINACWPTTWWTSKYRSDAISQFAPYLDLARWDGEMLLSYCRLHFKARLPIVVCEAYTKWTFSEKLYLQSVQELFADVKRYKQSFIFRSFIGFALVTDSRVFHTWPPSSIMSSTWFNLRSNWSRVESTFFAFSWALLGNKLSKSTTLSLYIRSLIYAYKILMLHFEYLLLWTIGKKLKHRSCRNKNGRLRKLLTNKKESWSFSGSGCSIRDD